MRSTFSCLLLALVLLPAGKVVAIKTNPGIQLLETGEFHGDEVGARTGERWLGLFPVANGFALRTTTVSVATVHDRVVDGKDTEKKSGKKVMVHRDREPVFLVKGAGMLRPDLWLRFFGK